MKPRPQILVVIPAHNEERDLEHCIDSVLAQTRPADRIVVVLDACEDNTEAIARSIRARKFPALEIHTTVDNAHKKAGALNEVLLRKIMPGLDDDDFVLVLDADGWLFPEFLENAVAKLAKHRDAGAVCGSYYGPPERKSLLHLLQRNEYARFARITSRQKNRAYVLSGVSTLYRIATLRAIAAGRVVGTLPGGAGDLWDTTAATEDIEMTHAVKVLGFKPMALASCRIYTDTMPTFEKLKHQRVRWQRGMLDSLGVYGMRKMAWSYYCKMVTLYLSSLVPLLWMAVIATSYLMFNGVRWWSWWLLVIPLMLFERVFTVRREGPRAMFLAVLLVPEIIYETWRSYLYWIALLNWIRKTERIWHPT